MSEQAEHEVPRSERIAETDLPYVVVCPACAVWLSRHRYKSDARVAAQGHADIARSVGTHAGHDARVEERP